MMITGLISSEEMLLMPGEGEQQEKLWITGLCLWRVNNYYSVEGFILLSGFVKAVEEL